MYLKGLAIIENVPKTMNGLPSLMENAFLPPEMTHYGMYWRVEQKFDANNIAYTGATIGLHRDLPFYANGPGVQLLHCLGKYNARCLKIAQNVTFQFWHFPPFLVLLKLTFLVTMLDRKLQGFKISPKWTIFGILNQSVE